MRPLRAWECQRQPAEQQALERGLPPCSPLTRLMRHLRPPGGETGSFCGPSPGPGRRRQPSRARPLTAVGRPRPGHRGAVKPQPPGGTGEPGSCSPGAWPQSAAGQLPGSRGPRGGRGEGAGRVRGTAGGSSLLQKTPAEKSSRQDFHTASSFLSSGQRSRYGLWGGGLRGCVC